MIDLLIAGGGPAGLATALQAEGAGLSAVVVEPRRGPIDKACGEGLMPHAVAELAALGVEPNGAALRGIRYVQGSTQVEAAFRQGDGLGLRRVRLHAALHEAVAARGIEIVQDSVHTIVQDSESVSAAGIRARYLVAADGLHSRIRRELAGDLTRPRTDRRWGLRAHAAVAPWTDLVEVHWSAGGEAYVTPLGPNCVGIAVLGSGRGTFEARLETFPELAARLHGTQCGPVRAAGPMRQDVSRRVYGRVLLVGDAAGYLDALTGEGIALALGCARAAVRRVSRDEPESYERDYRKISGRYLALTAALLWAAGRPWLRRGIVPAAAAMPWLFRAAVDQLASGAVSR